MTGMDRKDMVKLGALLSWTGVDSMVCERATMEEERLQEVVA